MMKSRTNGVNIITPSASIVDAVVLKNSPIKFLMYDNVTTSRISRELEETNISLFTRPR